MNFEPLDKLCSEPCYDLFINEPMSLHTSFKIGGNAKRLVCVKTKESLSKLVKLLGETEIPYMLLGNGSNLLVSDDGLQEAVITLGGDFCAMRLEGDKIICGAGVSLSALCIFARNNCLTGLEFAYGIPGTAGGAAYMNAGAYGGEMKDALTLCRHVDTKGEAGEFSGEALSFGYRKSAYTGRAFIITELELTLKKGKREDIALKMDELMSRRREKQPLEFPSAGSVFKRPQGYFAAALIEECGLKGLSVGGARVSEKHSGFIINSGGASCSDVRELIDRVKKEVKRQKGIELECEIMYVK